MLIAGCRVLLYCTETRKRYLADCCLCRATVRSGRATCAVLQWPSSIALEQLSDVARSPQIAPICSSYRARSRRVAYTAGSPSASCRSSWVKYEECLLQVCTDLVTY